MRGRTTCIMEYEGFPRAQVLTNQIQVIQGGQTFEGRGYLIGLESDMELSRGRNEKGCNRSHFNPFSNICAFHIIPKF